MLSQDVAVQVVSRHLEEKGFAIEYVSSMIGGTPIIVARAAEVSASIWVCFGHGVASCCGPKDGPHEWEATVRHLRAGQQIKQMLTAPPEASLIPEDPQLVERMRSVLRDLGDLDSSPEDFLKRIAALRQIHQAHPERFHADRATEGQAIAVVLEGSIEGHDAELADLAEELDTPLIVIDSEQKVASAGLK